jgi:hypothetical protein
MNQFDARSSDGEEPAGMLNRRTFMARGALLGAASLLPATSLMAGTTRSKEPDAHGDAAVLRFLAAAEIIETDLWQQYAELASGNPDFKNALLQIDNDMVAYVGENTEDERSHATFLNAFLASEHKQTISLDEFRTLPSSTATGAMQVMRITNLMQLNVDTSCYTRYRANLNPDFGDTPPQIINIVDRPGIPLHDGYTANEIQAIANTAAFHFGMIEQGGSSLYDAMSAKAHFSDTLRIITNIGGTEVAHFAIWNDKAGSVPPVDSGDGLVFPDLTKNTTFRNNQVMPKPCRFLRADLPICSVIRPTASPAVTALLLIVLPPPLYTLGDNAIPIQFNWAWFDAASSTASPMISCCDR